VAQDIPPAEFRLDVMSKVLKSLTLESMVEAV
jgi:hypothetical protein